MGEAIELQAGKLERTERECPRPCVQAVRTYIELSSLYAQAGRTDEALAHADLAVETLESTQGPDAPELARALMRRAEAFIAFDREDEAVDPLRRVVELRTRHKGEAHIDTLSARAILGTALLRSGQTEDGVALLEQTAERARDVEFPAAASSILNQLGSEYTDLDRHDDARRVLLTSRSLAEQSLPPQHPAFAILEANLARVDIAEGNHERALEGFVRALAMRRRAAQEQDASMVKFLYNVARAHERVGQPSQGVPFLDEASALLREESLRSIVVDVEVARVRLMTQAGLPGVAEIRAALLARCAAADPETRERSGCGTAETRFGEDPPPDRSSH